jgi:outer membrane protein
MKGKLLIVLALFLFFNLMLTRPGRAQLSLDELGYNTDAPLTLEDCIKIALTGNPAHQKYKANITLSSSNVLAAYGNFLPSISGGYSVLDDEYYNATYQWPDGSIVARPVSLPVPADTSLTFIDTNGNGTLEPDEIVALISPETSVILDPSDGRRRYSYGYIQLTQTLFAGGRNFFNLRSARSAKKASEFSLDRDRQLLTYNISQSYFSVLANQQILELSERALEQRKEQLRLAKARYNVGSVTKLDVMQAEIDLGNQENDYLQAEQELKISQMELNRLMGVFLEESYPVVDDSVLFAPVFSSVELVQQALEHRPDLSQLKSDLSANENTLMAERGSYLPTVNFDLSFTTDELDNRRWTFSPVNHDTRFGFNLSWDFFSGFSRENRIKQAKVSTQNAKYDIMDRKLSIEKEVKEAVLSLERIYSQSRITRKNRELASENLALERERYRLGSASLLDLRIAQVTYIQAETDHISKLLEFKTTLSQLEYATGLEIKEGEIGGRI